MRHPCTLDSEGCLEESTNYGHLLARRKSQSLEKVPFGCYSNVGRWQVSLKNKLLFQGKQHCLLSIIRFDFSGNYQNAGKPALASWSLLTSPSQRTPEKSSGDLKE